ncbi:Thermostable hemolysin [compost metagenome]
MGLHFHVIDKANPNALGAAQKQWGNYYQQKPFVLAINVADALAVTEEIYNSNF